MNHSLSDIYDILRAGLDQAEQHKNHLYVTKPAEDHGLQQVPNAEPVALGIEDEWRLTDAAGDTVRLTWSMHDTSRSFETNGPDSNRLHLSLIDAAGQVLRQHGIGYYD